MNMKLTQQVIKRSIKVLYERRQPSYDNTRQFLQENRQQNVEKHVCTFNINAIKSICFSYTEQSFTQIIASSNCNRISIIPGTNKSIPPKSQHCPYTTVKQSQITNKESGDDKYAVLVDIFLVCDPKAQKANEDNDVGDSVLVRIMFWVVRAAVFTSSSSGWARAPSD